MKIAITGGAGFIGSNLNEHLSALHDVHTIDVKSYPTKSNHTILDLSDREKTLKFLEILKPQIIIHSAAMKNLLRCNRNPTDAHMHNVHVTKTIADYASKNNAFLIYISSDQVFDGERGMYLENDIPHPINVYGETKLGGEKIVSESMQKATIVRTAMVYGKFPLHLSKHVEEEMKKETFEGADQSLFPQWVVTQLRKKSTVNAYIDRFSTPTFIGDLCKFVDSIIKTNANGVFHAVGKDRVNRVEYAEKIAEVWGLDKKLIRSISYKEDAPRPKDCSLYSKMTSGVLGVKPLSLREGLKILKRSFV